VLGWLLWKPLTERGLFAPSHTDKKNWWSKRYGKEGRKRKKEGEGGAKTRKKIRRTTVTHTEPNTETNVPGETPPNRAYGANKVETSQSLGLASLNINFYQQT